MLRSVEVTVKKFEESHLRKLTKSRIKAFKASCLREVGMRFTDFCCESRCESIEKDRQTEAYEIYIHNMANINAIYAEKSTDLSNGCTNWSN
ncbi:hypothetical protein [Aeromonas phage 65.2]|uniref:Uncharacterized protein n=1 Tax=Aeromonas phage 65.2 TaxID=1932896 RepID=A0A219YC04_9CAUD|nr:hypothetical protein [Aeromonas phage 65.2]